MPDTSPPQAVRVTPESVARCLIAVIAGLILIQCCLLVLVHVFGRPYIFGLVDAFDFGGENNITALVSALMMVACALMLAFSGAVAAPPQKRLPWFLLAGVFVFLGIDEATMIHEYASAPMRALLGEDRVPHLAWVLPYGAAMLVLAAVLFPWFLKLERRVQLQFVLAGGLFVLGAIGFELAESQVVQGILAEYPDTDIAEFQHPVVDVLILFEESLEMTGLGLFLYALVDRMGGFSLRPER